jgi:hypothetical protein
MLESKAALAVEIIFLFQYVGWSRDSSVSIATGYRLDDQGVRVQVPVGLRIFFPPRRPGWLWGPPNGYRGALSPGVKWQGREADHSPPASVKVKKMQIYTFIPPYAFMVYCLIS